MTGSNLVFFLLCPHGVVYKGLPSACGLHRFLGCLLGHHFIKCLVSCFYFFVYQWRLIVLLCGEDSCNSVCQSHTEDLALSFSLLDLRVAVPKTVCTSPEGRGSLKFQLPVGNIWLGFMQFDLSIRSYQFCLLLLGFFQKKERQGEVKIQKDG